MSCYFPLIRVARIGKVGKENRYGGVKATRTPEMLVEVQVSAAGLENCSAVSVTALSPSNPLLGYIPSRNVCMCSPKDRYLNILHGTIYNNQELKIT